ncbi:MAG: hypothetical protein RLZZ597_757 [Cyanobacteriota bacterium]|jgi:hypothetical protein
MTTPTDFPILAHRRDAGDEALLNHQLTEKEQPVFREMDQATSGIAGDSDLDAYYQIVIPIGDRHGLSAPQSIAFWTRATFSTFEP